MNEFVYDADRFYIEEDHRNYYDNLSEVLVLWPSADDFEQRSEWNWSLNCVDEDGDKYHWGIQCWFDYSEPAIVATLRRLYIGSGSPQKNPTHCVMSAKYVLDSSAYPGADEFDEISAMLISMMYDELVS